VSFPLSRNKFFFFFFFFFSLGKASRAGSLMGAFHTG